MAQAELSVGIDMLRGKLKEYGTTKKNRVRVTMREECIEKNQRKMRAYLHMSKKSSKFAAAFNL